MEIQTFPKKFLQVTWILLRLSIFKLCKKVLRGSLGPKLAEREGAAKRGLYFPTNLFFAATGEEKSSFSQLLALFLLSDLSVGRELLFFFFPYSYCDLGLCTPESNWLCIINWRWPEKKTNKLEFLGCSKNICFKTCLSVRWWLFQFAKELHVRFCFFKSTLCVLLTGGTLAPKYCQISLSNRERSPSPSLLFPLYSSPSTSPSLPLTSYLHVSLFSPPLHSPSGQKTFPSQFALRSAIICIKFLINIKLLVNIIAIN